MQAFEVLIETPIPGTPDQVWEAFTQRADAYLWPVTYEPRVGGAERGLSRGGGVVTAWEPGHHFATRAERADGWWNQLDYWLDQLADGTTWLRYHHRSVAADEEVAEVLDGCRRHTDFYLHSLAEYVRWFSGRVPQYVSVEAGGAEPTAAAYAALGLGAPGSVALGSRVTLADAPGGPVDGVVDYVSPSFLGIRTADAFVRIYGREPWNAPTEVALHLFDPAADADAWRGWLEGALAGSPAKVVA